MKVFVIVIGLFVLAEPEDPQNGSAHALLLRAGRDLGGPHVAHVPVHKPVVRFLADGFRPASTVKNPEAFKDFDFHSTDESSYFLNGETVRFRVSGQSPPGDVEFTPEEFVHLGELGAGGPFLAGCVENDRQRCKRDGNPLTAGVVELTGGKLFPLNVDPDFREIRDITFYDESVLEMWGFRSFDDRGDVHGLEMPLYNAVGFSFGDEVDVESLEIMVGGSSFSLREHPGDPEYREICEKLAKFSGATEGGAGAGPAQGCSIVVVSNLSDLGEVRDARSDENGEVDSHFAIVYDLLASAPEKRYIPYLKHRSASEANKDTPGTRCIPPSGGGD